MTSGRAIKSVSGAPWQDKRCLKSPHADPLDRAADYENRGLVAMENDDWRRSDVYFEWARLEREGAGSGDV